MMFERLIYSPESGHLYWRKTWEIAGCINGEGYRVIRYDKVLYLAHHIAWAKMTGSFPDQLIDHKNTKRSDNRWDNLREVTYSESNSNRKAPRTNTSGQKGVVAFRGKWRAQITCKGTFYHLGVFATFEEAKQAYQEASLKLHGDFAHESVSSGHGKQYVE